MKLDFITYASLNCLRMQLIQDFGELHLDKISALWDNFITVKAKVSWLLKDKYRAKGKQSFWSSGCLSLMMVSVKFV